MTHGAKPHIYLKNATSIEIKRANTEAINDHLEI